MTSIRAVKGMNDLFEEELLCWRRVETAARETCRRFGLGEIRTPILEETRLFARGVGEGTDIVDKEMYAFTDRDSAATSLCLRPENTAAVVRALVEHGRLFADAEERLYYIGAMFRRERPQKGRYRQFHQFGVEYFGLDAASADVELLALLHQFLTTLDLQNLTLHIGSLGDRADRPAFALRLRAYFADSRALLCVDCQRRLEQNPLRILDCKVPSCRALAENAPTPMEGLSDSARRHFDEVCKGLTSLNVPFQIDNRLVRGLDYYTRTVFEALADSGLGAQNAVAAGGRYDHLVEDLGGKPTPAIGFAAGIERLVLLVTELGAPTRQGPDIALVAADDVGRAALPALAMALRQAGLAVQVDHRGRSVKAQMKRADKSLGRFAAVIGSRELEAGVVQLKDLRAGSVRDVSLEPHVLVTQIRA